MTLVLVLASRSIVLVLVLVIVGLVLVLVLVLAGPVLDKSYLACNTHSIVLIVIYLFSVMGFTVICCELSLCVHCCCLIASVG